jgi:hypothetical protein
MHPPLRARRQLTPNHSVEAASLLHCLEPSLAAGLLYLRVVADLTGVSADPNGYESDGLSRYVWTAAKLGVGAVVYLGLAFGYFKRAGGPVPESQFLLIFAVVELGIIISVHSTLGML